MEQISAEAGLLHLFPNWLRKNYAEDLNVCVHTQLEIAFVRGLWRLAILSVYKKSEGHGINLICGVSTLIIILSIPICVGSEHTLSIKVRSKTIATYICLQNFHDPSPKAMWMPHFCWHNFFGLVEHPTPFDKNIHTKSEKCSLFW